MKKLIIMFTGIFLISHGAISQQIKPSGVFSGGGLISNANTILTYTIGEPVSGNISNNSVIASQGFQQKWTTEVASVLTISFNSYNANNKAGNTSVNVSSNIAWTATSDKPWLTLSNTSGTGNQAVTFNWTENTTTNKRTGKVTFAGTGVTSQIFTIVQDSTVETFIENDFTDKLIVKAYPNPTKDIMNVSWGSDNGETKIIEIFDSTGKLLSKITTNNKNALFDLSGFVNGYYLIKISSLSGSTISSIKIQKTN
ncbi:MAG: T9SS type A sorting domain-containing protein [Bacteroidales bacterium]|nr:T9SS type A sorting domain-containing protein [Bacteroidales bacterium]